MIPDAAKTNTIEDLGALVGHKPEMSKNIVTLYPGLTLQKLTELLGAVYSKKNVDNLNEIESFSFEWMIRTNQIPKIKIAEDCNEDGAGGAEIPLILERKYYDPRETFELENEQQLMVMRKGERLAADRWRYWVRLVSGNRDARINTTYLRRNRTTKYVSNYQPELSERGYNKFMFNAEKHRNYISRHRAGDSYSGDFAKLKEKYLEHAGMYYSMKSMDKDLLDYLYLSFENSMLLGHGNFDDKGKCLITEEDGRDIPIGEGAITQFKRYCGQQRYFNFSHKILREAINDVVSKKKNKQNNNLILVCNYRMFTQAQEELDNLLKGRVTDNYFYDVKGNRIKVGATYNAYEFAGNIITLMENEALTERYPDKGYGLIFDLYTDDGQPNIQMMTMKGMSLFRGDFLGMGGKTGGESGTFSSTVHGGRVEYMGYRGAKVANPYGGHIIEENVLW